MAIAQVSASLSLTVHDAFALSLPHNHAVSRLPFSNSSRIRTTFAGSPLLWRTSHQMMPSRKANPVSIRCEQSAEDSNSLDVWLGRLAMVGFASAISVEIATGKGLLENFGLTAPLPTVALGVTAVVGVLTAVFIFQSASKS